MKIKGKNILCNDQLQEGYQVVSPYVFSFLNKATGAKISIRSLLRNDIQLKEKSLYGILFLCFTFKDDFISQGLQFRAILNL